MTLTLGRPMVWVLSACGALILALGAYKALTISMAIAEQSKFAPPPEAVTALVVKKERWEPTLEVVGSLEAIEGVTVSTEESGRVAEIRFEPGSLVKRGDVLVQLDVSVEQAELRSAQARAKLSKLNLDRLTALVSRKLSAQADLDTAVSEMEQAHALLNEIQARVNKRSIIAPFDGRLGIRQISLGEYVNAGNPLVPLYREDPLYLNLAVPQQEVHRVSTNQLVRFTVDSFPGKVFEGTVTAVNPQVEVTTRNVKVQATVRNSDGSLKPGMFVSAKIVFPNAEDLVTVPSTAISYAPYGDSIFVVERVKGEDGQEVLTARQQFVQLGATRGDQVAVMKGINPGDEVVTSGVFKLRPNGPIMVNNDISPSNSENPTPADT